MFRYRAATMFSAAVSRGEAELLESQAVSTYATARVTHDFGSFGLGAGVRQGEVENVSSTLGWFASAFYDYREVRIVAEIESRDSELARTSFTEDFGPGVGVVSGISAMRRGQHRLFGAIHPGQTAMVAVRGGARV